MDIDLDAMVMESPKAHGTARDFGGLWSFARWQNGSLGDAGRQRRPVKSKTAANDSAVLTTPADNPEGAQLDLFGTPAGASGTECFSSILHHLQLR